MNKHNWSISAAIIAMVFLNGWYMTTREVISGEMNDKSKALLECWSEEDLRYIEGNGGTLYLTNGWFCFFVIITVLAFCMQACKRFWKRCVRDSSLND